MTAQRLLAHFDRVVDVPDAIPRLRSFVLDLAVQGKLVEQDPADEPAEELLERIAQEKARLNVSHHVNPLSVDETPFSLPVGWLWSRIGELCTKTGSGSTPRGGKNVYKTVGVPFLRSQNVHDDGLRLDDVACIERDVHARMAGTAVRSRDLLLNITGGSMGRCCRVPDEFGEANVSQHVAIIRPAVPEMADFLQKLLLSPYLQALIFDEQTGAGRGGLPKYKMDRILVAVPPLAEQHRIVTKVDELIALCDRLEESRAVREDTRNRLAKASYVRLSAPDADGLIFRSHARFVVDALPEMTARADQVKLLSQTILDLAVRGKLVEQDPEDEPPPRFDDAIPFDLEAPFPIPPNWRWSRLSALGMLKGGGTPSKARDDYWSGSIPWVSPKDMKVDYIAETQSNITEAAVKGSAVKLIEAESILFVVRGMILAHSFPVAISRVPLAINQDMKAITLKNPEMAEYLLLALKGLKFQVLKRVRRSSHGTCRVESRDYRDLMIPLPPLIEQHRIVAKVDELMVLCDGLETSLGFVNTGHHRLFESLLQEVLGFSVPEVRAA